MFHCRFEACVDQVYHNLSVNILKLNKNVSVIQIYDQFCQAMGEYAMNCTKILMNCYTRREMMENRLKNLRIMQSVSICTQTFLTAIRVASAFLVLHMFVVLGDLYTQNYSRTIMLAV